MNGYSVWVKCDVPGCPETLVLEGERSMRGLYDTAREVGWAIREDSINVGGGRRRDEHQHFCPRHRRPKSRRALDDVCTACKYPPPREWCWAARDDCPCGKPPRDSGYGSRSIPVPPAHTGDGCDLCSEETTR